MDGGSRGVYTFDWTSAREAFETAVYGGCFTGQSPSRLNGHLGPQLKNKTLGIQIPMPFFRPGHCEDEIYRILRDAEGEIIVDGREFVEMIWEQCCQFLDDDLPRKAMTSYASVFWELYLAHTLISSDLEPVRRVEREPAREGPDLLLATPRVWVEAVAPGPGEGPDAVPEPTVGEARPVPDDQIILRYRSALASKEAQIREHRARGWVRDDDPVVIAVNGARIPSARLELTIPRIVRSVLPFGHEQFHVDTGTMDIVDHTFQYRAFVQKLEGAEVAVDVFDDDSFSGISAVLASCSDEINRPKVAGSDFVLVHNPRAQVPLPRGWLERGQEFWVEEDALNRVQHSPDT